MSPIAKRGWARTLQLLKVLVTLHCVRRCDRAGGGLPTIRRARQPELIDHRGARSAHRREQGVRATMRPKAAARRRVKDAQRRSARDDHMRLHFSVDRSLTETLRDLASGGFRRFGKPARIS
jgi:hypothetical protein